MVKSTVEPKKTFYRSPAIVDMGDASVITMSGGTPLRDNNNDELRTYEKGAGGIRPSYDDMNDEVDLGGR